MNKLVMIIILISFVFIITYDPKKGKKFLPIEKYQVVAPQASSSCDEARFLELQGLTGTCAAQNTEVMGVVMESPNMGSSGRLVGYELE